MIITVSGWPGAGSSTLALILAKTLGFQLLQGTEVFRYLGEKLHFKDEGTGRLNADEKLEPKFGLIYDKYLKNILQERIPKTKLIIESDMAGFFAPDSRTILDIFIIASKEARSKRLISDDRQADVRLLSRRDLQLETIYKKINKFDIFDLEQIQQEHDLVIDNTNMSIQEELKLVYEQMKQADADNVDKYDQLVKDSSAEEEFYLQNGKKSYMNYLTEAKLLFDVQDLLSSIKKNFEKDIKKLPQSLQDIIQ